MVGQVAGSGLASFPAGGLAVVAGATGGIGHAVREAAEGSGAFAAVLGLARATHPAIDLEDEVSIAAAAAHAKANGMPLRLFFDATGLLHGEGIGPEKSVRALDPAAMAKTFAVNATGPALLVKHFLPLLPRAGKAVFATLSAKVGSIGDNRLGGWHSYRASKAALNQIVKTVSAELARTHPDAAIVALHPGTVRTRLSEPFAKSGLTVIGPAEAAASLLATLDRLGPSESGGFFDRHGVALPW